MKNGPSIQALLETTQSEQVLTLPAYLFFIETVDVPSVVNPDELDDFAEITMESASPFPLEHIYWGYLADLTKGKLLLYAAHRDRVRQVAAHEIEAYAWVLPDFAALALSQPQQPVEWILESEESISLIQFDGTGSTPATILVRKPGDAPEQTVNMLRQQLRDSVDEHERSHVRMDSAALDDSGNASFRFTTANTANESDQLLVLPETEQLWKADIRSHEFKKTEKNARKFGALLLKITVWAAAFALLLIVAEGLLLGSGFWLQSRQNKVAQQRPIVDTISEQHSLMTKLEQIEQNDLQPIALLRELNLKRPAGIHFTKAIVEGENQIQLDGVANNVNAMNRYTDMLSQSGLFKLLEQPKTLTRQGKTTFSLLLGFTPPATTTPPPVSKEATDA
ncbi:fimbrial assembly family protein [Coraliomargarita akajimensis]|uniref:Fimbrial assembly family protein n=1 Tax=Coraliomargarita akajimensis (strain DSM 45221 / IAM 15411 / JCM 23193 / KCTC 12865 / 04OKA010-24) TaxID=583355 RepID=D5EJR0_CORAD|nr:fimbrial assembly family protein [Coraliomargarita akajimensis]ADE54659.1 Fimbrial assembly family protein [Coraliomargarita akajimensis DSM 45221]